MKEYIWEKNSVWKKKCQTEKGKGKKLAGKNQKKKKKKKKFKKKKKKNFKKIKKKKF